MNDLQPLFLCDFSGETEQSVIDTIVDLFEVDREEIGKVLIAYLEDGNYDSSAYFLVEYDGDLFEVHASHCSCNGYEGCWSPDRVTPKYLLSPHWDVSVYSSDLELIKARISLLFGKGNQPCE